jgi:hypothetical protein
MFRNSLGTIFRVKEGVDLRNVIHDIGEGGPRRRKVVAAGYSETSVHIYRTTLRQ